MNGNFRRSNGHAYGCSCSDCGDAAYHEAKQRIAKGTASPCDRAAAELYELAKARETATDAIEQPVAVVIAQPTAALAEQGAQVWEQEGYARKDEFIDARGWYNVWLVRAKRSQI